MAAMKKLLIETGVTTAAETAKIINDKATTEEVIDAIQVGGRNYIQRSTKQYRAGNWYWFGTGMPTTVAIKEGERFMLSWFVDKEHTNTKSEFVIAPSFGGSPYERITGTGRHTDNRKSFVFTATKDYPAGFIIGMLGNGNEGHIINSISHIQLERGNKATDWSPAPEDHAAVVPHSLAEQEVPGEFWLDYDGDLRQVYQRTFLGNISAATTVLMTGVYIAKAMDISIRDSNGTTLPFGNLNINSSTGMIDNAFDHVQFYILHGSYLNIRVSTAGTAYGALYSFTFKYTKA